MIVIFKESRMEFKVRGFLSKFYISTDSSEYLWQCSSEYLWQDGKVHHNVEGFGFGYWGSEDSAMAFLRIYNSKEKQMSDTQTRLDQITKDIALLQEEAAKLAQKVKDEQQYVFKAGDVVINNLGCKNVIVKLNFSSTELVSIRVNNGSKQGSGQKHFEDFGYKKIGELSEFIK